MPIARGVGVLIVAACLLAACGSVDSVHPLGDADTTFVDDALIGYWGAPREEERGPDEVPKVIVVGRSGEGDGRLEACALKLDDEQRVQVIRLSLASTRLGGGTVLDLRSPEPPHRHLFLGYAFDAPDRLRIRSPDVAFVAQAVMDGKIEGTVEGDSQDLDLRTVHLTAATPALRAFFEENAEAIFADAGTVLRRLRVGDGAAAGEDPGAGPATAEPTAVRMEAVSFEGASGRAVLEDVAKRIGLELEVREAARDRIDGMRVTLHLESVSAATLLEMVTRPYGLAWAIRGDVLVVDAEH